MSIGLLACAILALFLIAIVLWIVVRVNEDMGEQAEQKWKHWVGYVVLALILSLWSVVAGLFFLAVVWLLRQGPGPDSRLYIGDQEKKTARRVYTWLFLSSCLTVPFFFIALFFSYSSYTTTNNRLVLVALLPLMLHFPLVLGLTSKSVFVYRHTQQGILLLALRAGLAAISITLGSDPLDGIWLYLLGNGLLWAFGSIWGWVEVSRGTCWWMTRKGDAIFSEGPVPPKSIEPGTSTPEEYLDHSKWHLKNQRKKDAKEYAIQAFRRGNVEVRRQAVQILDDLNEVGFF